MRTSVGNRISRLRKQRNWTQDDLAREAGVGRSWLSMVESGDTENPGADKLTKLGRALGVPPEYLQEGERGEETVSMRVPIEAVDHVGEFSALPRQLRLAALDFARTVQKHFSPTP